MSFISQVAPRLGAELRCTVHTPSGVHVPATAKVRDVSGELPRHRVGVSFSKISPRNRELLVLMLGRQESD